MRESIPLTEAARSTLKRVECVPFGWFQRRLLGIGGMEYTHDAISHTKAAGS